MAPSKNDTVPVGELGFDVIVAVNVTGWPNVDGLLFELTDVVVA